VAPHLPVPFAVETGVNYLQPCAGEMSDGAFVAAVAEAADCGIVLDLHNLWANETERPPAGGAVLAELPLERIWEVHLAGGSEFQGYWLDGPLRPPCPGRSSLSPGGFCRSCPRSRR